MLLGAEGADFFRLLRAVGVAENLGQIPADGIGHAHALNGILRFRPGQRALVPGPKHPPQNGVDKPGDRLTLLPAGLFHRLVHGGMVGNPIQTQNLRTGDVQNFPNHGVGRGLDKRRHNAIQRKPVFHGGIEDAGGQPAILRRKMHAADLPVNGLRGVGPLLRHLAQSGQGHVPGIGRGLLRGIVPPGRPVRGPAGPEISVLFRHPDSPLCRARCPVRCVFP